MKNRPCTNISIKLSLHPVNSAHGFNRVFSVRITKFMKKKLTYTVAPKLRFCTYKNNIVFCSSFVNGLDDEDEEMLNSDSN